MADPQGIAVAFNDDWKTAEPTWTRLDNTGPWRVQAYTISRGRNSELDRTSTGTATITIADPEGDFDPTNATATFAGDLDPVKQAAITIQNPVTLEWRHLFRGFVMEWPGELHKTGVVEFLNLELADAMALFATAEMTPTSPPTWGDLPPFGFDGDIYFEASAGTEQVRARMHQVLDQFEWPSSLRHLFSGNVDLQAASYTRREPILNVLLDAADAEMSVVSNLFVGRRGDVIFRGRYARFDPDSYISTDDDDLRSGPAGNGGRLWEWSAGGYPEAVADPTVAYISDIAWRRSASDVINAAVALPVAPIDDEADVVNHLFKDDTSIDAYGWRFGPNMENLLVEAGNTPPGQTAAEECDFFAEYFVENYKTPKTRITRLVFRGVPVDHPAAAATWGLICGVEIGDPIHIETSHWGGAGGFDADYFIEGIRYECRPAAPGVPDITLELDVSPATFYSHNPWGTTTDPEDNDSVFPPT